MCYYQKVNVSCFTYCFLSRYAKGLAAPLLARTSADKDPIILVFTAGNARKADPIVNLFGEKLI